MHKTTNDYSAEWYMKYYKLFSTNYSRIPRNRAINSAYIYQGISDR